MTQATEQTAGKVAQLTPEEWKQLVLLGAAQLQNYVQQIPGNSETGAAGITEQHLALIDAHVGRIRSFMRAWSLSKILAMAPVAPPPDTQAPAPAGNGAIRKGGWPKGKKRAPKQAEAS